MPTAAVAACTGCRAGLRDGPPLRRWLATPTGPLLACGGRATGADLVALVAAWKYRRRRSAAAVAVRLARRARRLAVALAGDVELLVPVPLHPRRRAERGFNQAAVLAAGLAADGGGRVARLLERRRPTPQLARLAPVAAVRAAGVAGALRAVAAPDRPGTRVGLVDDLVTTGATAGAAAAALAAAGWRVAWVVACGVAVDRRDDGPAGAP